MQVLFKHIWGEGDLTQNAYFAYVVIRGLGGCGGLEAKCLCKLSEFLSTSKLILRL